MIHLILMLSIIGVGVWLITTKIPMDPAIKVVIQAVVLFAVVLYLLRLFGVADLPVPRL